ncbi:MAG: hypothetical protein LRY41_03315 [Candidatus Pacebacteria bacterium]|nr:hypothetical protein [Candidatus Paceibacterota bacterium]
MYIQAYIWNHSHHNHALKKTPTPESGADVRIEMIRKKAMTFALLFATAFSTYASSGQDRLPGSNSGNQQSTEWSTHNLNQQNIQNQNNFNQPHVHIGMGGGSVTIPTKKGGSVTVGGSQGTFGGGQVDVRVQTPQGGVFGGSIGGQKPPRW